MEVVYLRTVSMTTDFIFHARIALKSLHDTTVCKPVYIILKPQEYYMVLTALTINAASNPRLAASAHL